jgi:hypothetical protein
MIKIFKGKIFLALLALLAAAFVTAMPLAAVAGVTPALGDVHDGVDFSGMFPDGTLGESPVYNHRIYLGTYQHRLDASTLEPFATPILWRVMGEEKNSGAGDGYVTLLSEYVLDNRRFDNKLLDNGDVGSNLYYDAATPGDSSEIQIFLAGDFMSSFSGAEKADSVMAPSTVVTSTYALGVTATSTSSTRIYDSIAPAQKVYLPWGLSEGLSNGLASIFWSANGVISEIEEDNENNSIYRLLSGNYDLGKAYYKGGLVGSYYWLRSPLSNFPDRALAVFSPGGHVAPVLAALARGVRPAFKLNPASVIFASEIVTAPTRAGQTEADANGNYAEGTGNYKLTVVNDELTAGALTAGGQAVGSHPVIDAAPGYAVTVTAAGATDGANLTYKIVDSSRTIVGYGQGADNAALSVEAEDLDGADLPDGDYAVYVWAQVDSTINSNEGSAPEYFTLKVTADPRPEAPTGVAATAGNRRATVTFTPPAATNGADAVTGYTVTSHPGGVTATGAASPITVRGLTNGTAYTFTVTANDGINTSAPSTPSNSVTPVSPATPGGGDESGGSDAGGGDGNDGSGGGDNDGSGGDDNDGSGDGGGGGGDTDPSPVQVKPAEEATQPAANGALNESIAVTTESGTKATVTNIADTPDNEEAQRKLAEMGLSASVVNGEVVISGVATDIGAVTLEVGVSGSAATTTVTFTVAPLPPEPTTAASAAPSQWTGAFTESGGAGGLYSFTLYIPLDIAASDIPRVADAGAVLTGGTLSGSPSVVPADEARSSSRGAGEAARMKITGSTANLDEAAVASVSYRIGIHQYEQTFASPVKLAATSMDDQRSSGGGSGGCGVGANGFAALSLLGAAILRKKRA